MLRKIGRLICCVVLFSSLAACSVASEVSADAMCEVCFTPGDKCTQKIVATVARAKKQILVQAFTFTSKPIVKSLILAQHRGVEVRVILDKIAVNEYRATLNFLRRNGIEPLIDYKPSVAHNKVIIIDQAILITGSFNFTKRAQVRNAENLLFIYNSALAKKYVANWYMRAEKSLSAADYELKRKKSKVMPIKHQF